MQQHRHRRFTDCGRQGIYPPDTGAPPPAAESGVTAKYVLRAITAALGATRGGQSYHPFRPAAVAPDMSTGAPPGNIIRSLPDGRHVHMQIPWRRSSD
jgi:hypothetical protein